MSIVGSEGFVAWFYAIIYNKIRNACKNIIVKVVIHAIGLIMIIFGLHAIISTMPSFTSVMGVFLIFLGLVAFVIPFGVKNKN